MTGVFAPVTLGWNGVDYVLPADMVFGAIARIEQHVTLMELHRMAAAGGTFKMTVIASAYASLLTFAGAKDLTPEIVYAGMFSGATVQSNVMQSIMGLLSLMIPPNSNVAAPGEAKPSGEVRRRAGTSRSPRKHSRSA